MYLQANGAKERSKLGSFVFENGIDRSRGMEVLNGSDFSFSFLFQFVGFT